MMTKAIQPAEDLMENNPKDVLVVTTVKTTKEGIIDSRSRGHLMLQIINV
jgi:hypothetical protein